MRFLIIALICTLYAGCASTPKQAVSSVQIEEIKPRYIETEQFKRISEYLTGRENLGDRIVFRTNPKERSGFYFALILDTNVRKLPKGTVVVGEFYTKKSIDKQIHEFTLANKPVSTKEIFVGLTGEDWPEDSGAPSAWKFTLKDANGNILGNSQSYLWSL
ncbi:hypothetical protein QEH59_04250 [Coraliomargarita sp. SDUM461004]|uniref:Lipoprotein n=1 Tax=Thalassobacterium sedimentorum TaxID=3041258 RepID=A0ABU1AFQ0_9BACT|nr:hypothetical protein [Coraliomargarita sp. SDUM461004]MDQ8193621.1 hypothetical protein [Coraliomargarita sp. SDUM461004]